MKLKYLYCLFLIGYSVISQANSLVGIWVGKNNNKQHGYSIKVSKEYNQYFFSYIFIYDEGRKINDSHFDKPSFPLQQYNESCYKGYAIDSFTGGKAKVSLCRDNSQLIWSILEEAVDISYIPKKVVFIKEQSLNK